MRTDIKSFGAGEPRTEEGMEYYIKYLQEGITAGYMVMDTFLDLEYASELELEELLEDLVEQITYLTNLTNKTFMQQLKKETQDEILESKLYFMQIKYRYDFLSSGRLTKSSSMVYSDYDPTEEKVNWSSTKKLSLVGLYKYLNSIKLLIEEAYMDEGIKKMLDEDDIRNVEKFLKAMHKEKILENKELDIPSSSLLKVNYYLDSENEEGSGGTGSGEDSEVYANFDDLI